MTALADRIHSLYASPVPARSATLALGALCAVLAARLLWLLVAGPQIPVAPAAAPALPASAERAPLAGFHLFGQGGAVPVVAPASQSPLLLRGTFASPDPANGLAFIAEAAGRERAYRVGERLPDGAILDEVHAGHVILRREGRREMLSLPREGTATPPPRGQTPAAPADPSGGYLTGPLSFGVPDLATERAARAPDLAALAEGANVLPVVENGRVVGVRLGVRDPAVLARFGLDGEDIVTAVNGIPLDDPERRDALQNVLRAGGPIVLTVRRGGSERQVTLGL